MSLQVLSSVIEAITQISQCNRRKQVDNRAFVASRAKLLKYAACARSHDYEDATKATDLVEGSTTEASDGSDTINGGTDSSDTESPKIKMISAADLRGAQRPRLERRVQSKPDAQVQAPPGLSLPPGLDTPKPDVQKMQPGTRLNSSAALFVPSFGAAPATGPSHAEPQQMRQSIQMLKGALEDWEAHHLPAQPVNTPPLSADVQNIIALQQALSKLTTKEAEVVKNLLEAKEAEEKPKKQTLNLSAMCAETPASEISPCMQDLHGAWPCGFAGLPGQFYGQIPSSTAGCWLPQTWSNTTGTQHTFGPYSNEPSKAAQKQQAKPRKGNALDDSESLATHLRDLAALDSNRVLMVRKINHITTDAAAALKSHFSQFGAVERVMMSATRSITKQSRVRPATVGFLVMDTAEAVQAALAQGPEHMVDGVAITVSIFSSHPIDKL